jgi:hypothetical protein
MIELPPLPAPNGATPALIDYGGTLRSPLGGPALRVNRPGSRYRLAFTFPPCASANEGRVFVSRLIRAKRVGLRMPYPLLSAHQPVAGDPVVDGAGQSGLTLAVRGLQPGTTVREGFWLSIENTTGQHYLHNVAASVMAGSDGKATLTIEPMLRRPFADGCRIHLARPMIEGFVEGDEWQWSLYLDHNIGIEVAIEEAG